MWPRGEVGDGVPVLSLSYGIGGPVVIAATATPSPRTGKLNGEALVARKRHAERGAGTSQGRCSALARGTANAWLSGRSLTNMIDRRPLG